MYGFCWKQNLSSAKFLFCLQVFRFSFTSCYIQIKESQTILQLHYVFYILVQKMVSWSYETKSETMIQNKTLNKP